MFGNVPRPLWSRWCPPDDLGRIDLACRALLVERAPAEGGPPRRVLFETGIGAFFEPKLRERFGVTEGRHVLLDSLAAQRLSHADIDAVVLSHLHFDHAGGLLSAWEEGARSRLLFPRATFVVGREAWERAKSPHARDRASFVPGLVELLEASGRLEVVDGNRSDALDRTLGEGVVTLERSHGHTPGMLHAWVKGTHESLFFAADLVPGRAWVHVPVTMGYDRFPELLVDEKRSLFERLHAQGAWLFFTHDAAVAASRLARHDTADAARWSPSGDRDLAALPLDLDAPA